MLRLIGMEEDVLMVQTFYTSSLRGCVGEAFAAPSLSLLAKYWQDPSGVLPSVCNSGGGTGGSGTHHGVTE